MTSDEPGGEPTLRDVLAAIGNVAKVQGEHGAAIAALATGLGGVRESVDGVKADLAGLALDFHAYAELAESRHSETTQALEAIAGLVHQQQHAMAQMEGRLRSRIEDVQGVVQTLKADHAAHVSDTQVHRGSHGQAA